MDVSEKLVELLERTFESFIDDPYCIPDEREFADRLIAHGVTVQEWISVDDSLPKDDEIVTICTDKGFVYAGELIGDTWFLDNDSWTANVTHWMPLPPAPEDVK